MKTNCEIIRDLLPLYADHVTSEASNALVEEHLNECPDCKKELEQMKRPVPVKYEEIPDQSLRKIKRDIQKKIIRTVLVAVVVVLCVVAASTRLYKAQTLVTAEEAKIWTYNRKENGANLCYFSVKGDGVYFKYDRENFSWGDSVVHVQLVRYTYPKFHALLSPIANVLSLGRVENVFERMDPEGFAVSSTQTLAVQCADDVLYYRNGQQVYRYAIEQSDGSIKYVYGDPETILGRRYTRG